MKVTPVEVSSMGGTGVSGSGWVQLETADGTVVRFDALPSPEYPAAVARALQC